MASPQVLLVCVWKGKTKIDQEGADSSLNSDDILPLEIRLTTVPVEMELEVERVRHLRYMREIRL